MGDPVLNTRTAFQAGLAIYDATGCGVIVPHLTLLGNAMFPREAEYWYQFDLAQVAHCDAMLRLPGESSGSDREVQYAKLLGMPVFTNREELVRWAKA